SRALERQQAGDLYLHRGWAHFFADAWKLALRDFAKAIDLDPESSDAYTRRGLAQVMLVQYRDAAADAATALRLAPGPAEMMHNAACIFAQAVARVAADPGAADRFALRTVYRDRALEAIQQTLRMVPPEEQPAFWRDKVLPEPALAPIR